MRVIKIVPYLLILGLLAGCGSEVPEELLRLEKMTPSQARSEFLALPPDSQVKIVAWELENRRPASSRFDFLLQERGEKIVGPLLDEASATKNFDVYITFMKIYAELPVHIKKNERRRALNVLSRCDYLGGNGNDECRGIGKKMVQDPGGF